MLRPAWRRRGRRLALATLLAVALLALAAGAAQALIVDSNGQLVSYELVRGARAGKAAAKPLSKQPLVDHGGHVMPSNTNYTIYWDPSGGAAFPAGYETGIDRYFEDLQQDSGGLMNTDSVLTQYRDEFGEVPSYDSHFGGAYADTDPYPANGCSAAPTCLTEEQLKNELVSFVQSHALPMDLEHEYFLLTPKGVENCREANGHKCSAGAQDAFYCAYHNYIELGKGAVIIFAVNPYVDGTGRCGDEQNTPNGNPSDVEISGGLAHEHSESVTDPELNAWHDEKGNEVADKCQFPGKPESEYGPPLGKVNGSDYNEVINGHFYWYQQMWSNEISGCAQRRLQAPVVKKLKPKNGPEAGGTEVTITGTGFTPAATVAFGEAEASEVKYESPTTIVAVSPGGEAGFVFVAVSTEGGTSVTSTKTRFKYKPAKKPRGH